VRDKMSLLNNAKTIGGVGSLLILLGLIPSIGALLGIIGFILVFIAVKYISEETKDKTIFNNFLYFFITAIIAIVVSIVILAITFLEAGGISYLMELQNLAYTNPSEVWNAIQPVIPGFLATLATLWVLLLISAIFLRKSYDKIGEHTKVKWFNTTAFLFLIGAATLIIVIGVFIILVGIILEIIAFFSLPDKLPNKTEQ
jgi:uncharacterized membrane protein